MLHITYNIYVKYMNTDYRYQLKFPTLCAAYAAGI